MSYFSELYEKLKRELAEPTKMEKMLAEAHKQFEINNVVARGPDVTKTLALWGQKGYIGPLWREGKVYATPYMPINDYVFVGVVGACAVFMKQNPLLLYQVPNSQFDQVISMDAFQLGVSRAAWQVPIIHAVVEFSLAAMGGFLAMGWAITVVSGAAQIAALAQYFARNEEKVKAAATNLKSIFEDMQFLKNNCPSSYKLLVAVLMSGQSKDIDREQFIGEMIAGKASDWGATIGKALAGDGPGAAIQAAERTAIALTLTALLSFRTLLVEVLKVIAKGVVTNIPTIVKLYGTAAKLYSGKGKEMMTDADIQRVLTSGCIQTPAVKQRIEKMAKSVSDAIVVLEEMKKQLADSSI